MKLLFVLTSLGAGGAEKCVATIAAHRAAMGDDVVVLSFVARPEGSYFAFPETVRLEAMSGSGALGARGPLRAVRRLAWLRARIRAHRPDLVAAFLTKNVVLALIATLGLGAPVLAAERNNPEVQRGMGPWWRAFRILGRRANTIVMLTKRALGHLPASLQRKAIVIPNPCALPSGADARPGDRGRLVAVGRLDWQKGFDLLIDAFAQISARHPSSTLTLFGEGPERAALERRVRAHGLDGRVFLPGVTERPISWIESADVFVMSSRHEGFSNALLEAMGAGLPCVSFDCDFGPDEVLDHGAAGMLAPNGDVEGLAAALDAVLGDAALRSRLSAAARAHSASFALEGFKARWDAALQGAASPRPPGSGSVEHAAEDASMSGSAPLKPS